MTTRWKIISPLQSGWSNVCLMQDRHRTYIRSELSQVRGLIPILMKHRNGENWSTEERILLQRDLRALSNLSPYLVPLLMPGGFVMFPLLAWWLDNRHNRRITPL